MQNTGKTIQTIAARCGMTAHTLRYYERIGLIQPVWRAGNGHRRYSEQDEKWLRFLKSMRTTRMPIREMLRHAALHNHGENRLAEQCKILEEHRAILEKQIADLHNALALLTIITTSRTYARWKRTPQIPFLIRCLHGPPERSPFRTKMPA